MEKVPIAHRGRIDHRVVQYGTSVLGAPLELFMPLDAVPSLLIMAAHHGDEVETTTLLSSALRSIAPHQLQCAVILAANPDGLSRGTRGNARGVDLNRNFPTRNWQKGSTLHSWNGEYPKTVELSTGETPASEPETQALLKLVDTLSPRIIVSLHSRLACVDDPNETPLAQWLSQQMNFPLVRDIGYPTPGSFGTWAGENALELITLELPDESVMTQIRKFGSIFQELLTQPDELIEKGMSFTKPA